MRRLATSRGLAIGRQDDLCGLLGKVRPPVEAIGGEIAAMPVAALGRGCNTKGRRRRSGPLVCGRVKEDRVEVKEIEKYRGFCANKRREGDGSAGSPALEETHNGGGGSNCIAKHVGIQN